VVKPRVLFVEDEESISGPFSSALTREGFDPVVCGTLGEARAAWARDAFDLVLLDLMLPDGDGRDLARELRGSGSEVPIIILTARGTELERVVGLELGADDYVVKPFSGAEVIARMRAVLRRVRPAASSSEAPAELSVGPLRVELGSRRAYLDGAELALSRKEFDLLTELMSHAGEVVTREDLISRVWDENWFGSTKTLDVHVGWLRGKLGDDASNPRLLHTVRGVGFRFTGPEEWAS
jgi:two-component system response regulator RegX3